MLARELNEWRTSVATTTRLTNCVVVAPATVSFVEVTVEILRAVGWPAVIVVFSKKTVTTFAELLRSAFHHRAEIVIPDNQSTQNGGTLIPTPRITAHSDPSILIPKWFEVLLVPAQIASHLLVTIPWTTLRCIIFCGSQCANDNHDPSLGEIASLIFGSGARIPRLVWTTTGVDYDRNMFRWNKRLYMFRMRAVLVPESVMTPPSHYLPKPPTKVLYVDSEADSATATESAAARWPQLEAAVAEGKTDKWQTFIVKTVQFIESQLQGVVELCFPRKGEEPSGYTITLTAYSSFHDMRRKTPLKKWGIRGGYAAKAFLSFTADLPLDHPGAQYQELRRALLDGLPFWYEAIRILTLTDPPGVDIALLYLRKELSGRHSSVLQGVTGYPFAELLPDLLQVKNDRRGTTEHGSANGSNSIDIRGRFHRLESLLRDLVEMQRQRQVGERREENEPSIGAHRPKGVVLVAHPVTAHVVGWWIATELRDLVLNPAVVAVADLPAFFSDTQRSAEGKQSLLGCFEGRSDLLVISSFDWVAKTKVWEDNNVVLMCFDNPTPCAQIRGQPVRRRDRTPRGSSANSSTRHYPSP